jgi:hypothetical protein
MESTVLYEKIIVPVFLWVCDSKTSLKLPQRDRELIGDIAALRAKW